MPRIALLALPALAMLQSACHRVPEAEQPITATADPPTASQPSCPAGDGPVLSGQLHGAIAGTLNTSTATTHCEGMSRPDARGVRLRFKTTLPSADDALVIILGIDRVVRGDTGEGIRTTVTLIDERDQRFYSNGEQNSCFSDIELHEVAQNQRESLLSGLVWCTAGVPALTGSGSVRLTDLRFRGTVQWRDAS
ncbi:MAG: hypothetical protein AAF290_05175 [Pseudomonadota bacterium]